MSTDDLFMAALLALALRREGELKSETFTQATEPDEPKVHRPPQTVLPPLKRQTRARPRMYPTG